MRKVWHGFILWLKHEVLENGSIMAIVFGLIAFVVSGLLSLEPEHTWRPRFAAMAGLVAIGVGFTMIAVNWVLFALFPALVKEIQGWPTAYRQLKEKGYHKS